MEEMMSNGDVDRARYQIWILEIDNEAFIEELAYSKYPAIARDELKRRIKDKKVMEWIKSVISGNTRPQQSTQYADLSEDIQGIAETFTKHSPQWHLSKMKGSAWYNANLPGILEDKIGQAKDTINGEDEIRSSPAMCKCKWSELKEYGRDGFLIVMIKKFRIYNQIHKIVIE
jgi:hypothetical protein